MSGWTIAAIVVVAYCAVVAIVLRWFHVTSSSSDVDLEAMYEARREAGHFAMWEHEVSR